MRGADFDKWSRKLKAVNAKQCYNIVPIVEG